MSETPAVPVGTAWGSGNGIAAAAKYNPHLWSSDELRAIFVARHRELETILQVLRTSSPTVAPQHLLITGQRGMGKSTLLQRVALAVDDDIALSETWVPLRFPEEQYTVSTPAELWINVIGALADAVERKHLPAEEIDAELSRILRSPESEREASSLAWLHQWCERNERRLLLLVDSTDLLFANLASGGASKAAENDGGASALWRVRRALLHSPHFLWLGGSYQPLEAQGLYSDAFLDFFQLIELRPLTLAEMQDVILAMAQVFGVGRGLSSDGAVTEFTRMLTERPERLRAMRQLTGGNPRTTVMLYELFAVGGRDNLRSDLERLLDIMTPLYKARLEVLADQPRKVLAHVMEHWAPIAAKSLASAAALPVSSVSAQLSRLEQEGLVEKTALSGTKRQGFQASERFFNIWYLMRNAPRGARSRVGWLVEFMRLWYSSEELHGLARSRRNELRDGRHCEALELECSRAVARAMPDDAEERRQLDYAVFQQARRGPAFGDLFDLAGEDAGYTTPFEYTNRLDALREELKRIANMDRGQCAWAEEVAGALHLTLAEKEQIARELRLVSPEKVEELRQSLASKKEQLLEHYSPETVGAVESAVTRGEFFADCPDSKLALTQMLNRFDSNQQVFYLALTRLANRHRDANVEKACRRAIEMEPTYANPWQRLGDVLSEFPDRYDEAEDAYRKSIELDPKLETPWFGLGDLFADQLNRHDEAEAAYRKASDLDPKWPSPWLRLGDLFEDRLNRLDDAELAYRKASDLDPKWPTPWLRLGNLFADKLNRLDEAESAYRKAGDLNAKWAAPWLWLGDLFANKLNRLDDAESAYRKGSEVDPKSPAPWLWLGNLFADKLNRLDEAESAYRKASDLDPKSPTPWLRLGGLFEDKLNRLDAAESAYRKASDLDPKWPSPWLRLGDLFEDKLNRLDEAESAYRKASDLDPKSPTPWLRLGDLFEDKLNRLDAAESAYRKAIDIHPNWPTSWLRLGNLFAEKLNRLDDAESAYRKAIDVDPKWATPGVSLGNLLQDRMKRFAEAEQCYLAAIKLDPEGSFPKANLARLLAMQGRADEASALFRQALQLDGISRNGHVHDNLRLQAHCWLGNRDLAIHSLDVLAERARNGDRLAFDQLKEQCFECHAMGQTMQLADLMEHSRSSGFLQPFALALHAATGNDDALLDAAVEVRMMALDVLAVINGSYHEATAKR